MGRGHRLAKWWERASGRGCVRPVGLWKAWGQKCGRARGRALELGRRIAARREFRSATDGETAGCGISRGEGQSCAVAVRSGGTSLSSVASKWGCSSCSWLGPACDLSYDDALLLGIGDVQKVQDNTPSARSPTYRSHTPSYTCLFELEFVPTSPQNKLDPLRSLVNLFDADLMLRGSLYSLPFGKVHTLPKGRLHFYKSGSNEPVYKGVEQHCARASSAAAAGEACVTR
jgi:hypothetical protein